MSAASRRDDGSYELDPAEVTRCFPPRPPVNGGATASMTQYATANATAALAEAQHRAELVEQRLSDMKVMFADMTAQREIRVPEGCAVQGITKRQIESIALASICQWVGTISELKSYPCQGQHEANDSEGDLPHPTNPQPCSFRHSLLNGSTNG
jgi:hypothetical protein